MMSNTMGMKLKYLFEVEYTDGTVFKQGKDDVSESDPTRSAFYDVLNSDKDVKTFAVGPLQVNLLDGSFLFDGVEIFVGDEIGPCERKLIFYRQHQHDFNNDYEANSRGIFKFLKSEETGHRVKYFVGWEANIGGKTHKKILGVK